MERAPPGRIVYGPEWPDPDDAVGFLEQALQFTRAAIADGRPFQPQRALLILIDDREGKYKLCDVVHDLPTVDALGALAVSTRRFAQSIDPEGRNDDLNGE